MKIRSWLVGLFALWLPCVAQAQVVVSVDPQDKDAYGTIEAALEVARAAWQTARRTTTILIAPGTYYEELTIDVPHLCLKNAYLEEEPQAPLSAVVGVRDGGVRIGEKAVRISWYYGHGYQYASMGDVPNYGGSRTRLWNASVLVNAPYFQAEGIIFENSFNMYVSPKEAMDTLVDISQSPLEWTAKERPKREMPLRPKTAYSTEVQKRYYRERASAISFTSEAQHCTLSRCRVVGRQDAFYGDHGASVWAERCILQGAVDYIFGGLTLLVDRCELVSQTNEEKGDKCYISAARGANRVALQRALVAAECEALMAAGDTYCVQHEGGMDSVPMAEYVEHGMLFVDCMVRHATAEEIVQPGSELVYLGRPWRWWGETLFVNCSAKSGVLMPVGERWSLGLTKGKPAPCSVEIKATKKEAEGLRQEWLDIILPKEE